MKKIILTFVIIANILIVTNLGESNNKGRILIMPKQLVDLAEKNGYAQIDEFYSVIYYETDPCFIYTDISNEKDTVIQKKAVFLCRKIDDIYDWRYYLLFATFDNGLKLQEVIDGVILGGISVIKDTTATLDEFHYRAEDNLESGPEDVDLTNKIIRIDNGDGIAVDYYKYKGKWLVRTWD